MASIPILGLFITFLLLVGGYYLAWLIYWIRYWICWPSFIWYLIEKRTEIGFLDPNCLNGWRQDIKESDLRLFWYCQPITRREWNYRAEKSNWIFSRSFAREIAEGSRNLQPVEFREEGASVQWFCDCYRCPGHSKWVWKPLDRIDKWWHDLTKVWLGKYRKKYGSEVVKCNSFDCDCDCDWD